MKYFSIMRWLLRDKTHDYESNRNEHKSKSANNTDNVLSARISDGLSSGGLRWYSYLLRLWYSEYRTDLEVPVHVERPGISSD